MEFAAERHKARADIYKFVSGSCCVILLLGAAGLFVSMHNMAQSIPHTADQLVTAQPRARTAHCCAIASDCLELQNPCIIAGC